MKSKEKKFTFTKIITVICTILFCFCLYKTFTFDYSTIIDTAAIVCMDTVTGGIFGACVVHYMKKSQSENLPKISTGVYRDTMNIRLEYNEKMMQLKKKYNISDEDVYDIESQGNMDEISDSVLDTALGEINSMVADAHTPTEIQNY